MVSQWTNGQRGCVTALALLMGNVEQYARPFFAHCLRARFIAALLYSALTVQIEQNRIKSNKIEQNEMK